MIGPRQKFLLPTVALLSLLLAPAAALEAQQFWSHRVGIEIDVPYGEDPMQVADVYTQGQRPAGAPGFVPSTVARPTLIWIHGGGWIRGDKATNGERFLHFLERGWHVVNINYRQGPGTAPQAVDDALCAYKWVVDRALANGQSNRFVVGGASAGGHLALMVGLMNAEGNHPCRAAIAPSAIANWFGITDIAAVDDFLSGSQPDANYARAWIGEPSRIAEISRQYSPIAHVSAAAPPIITIHGTADPTVPYIQAETLHTALTTRNRLVTLEGGTHGGFSDSQYQQAMTAIFEFLADDAD
jgi:acetyl esterase/lipase